jgi:hypothetical protein
MVQPPFEEGHFVKPTFRKHCLPLSGQRAAVPSSENFKISMVAPMNLKITKVALKNSSMMATKFYVKMATVAPQNLEISMEALRH